MKFYDLFGGVGGFRIGMEAAGHKCVGYADNDKYAVQVYNKNFGEEHEARDTRKIQWLQEPDFDILCAGFPCQPFSIAGKEKGFSDTRGTLFFEIARAVKAKQPEILFLENVKGLLSHNRGRTFRTILMVLDQLGYDAEWQVFNTKDWLPQHRERVFLIGHLRNTRAKQIFPLKNHTEKIYRTFDEHQVVAQRDRTLAGKGECFEIQEGHTNAITSVPKDNLVVARAMRWVRTEKGKQARKESIKQGKDTTPFNYGHRELVESSEGIVGCITSADNKDSIISQNTKLRRLTPLECERLQGFPDNWTACVSDSQRYKQMGNAVSVPVIKAISVLF